MRPIASVEDYQTQTNRLVAESETERVQALLDNASAFLRLWIKKEGLNDPEHLKDEDYRTALKMVCCQMVWRILQANDRVGITQFSQTAGPYTESGTIANPNGDMYLTNTEKELLQLKGRKTAVNFWRPAIHDDTGAEIDW